MRYDIATERTKLTERFRDTKLAVMLARAFGSEAAFLMRIDEAAANGTFDGLFAAKLCLPLLDDTQIDEKRLVRLAYDALTERLYPTEEGLSLTQAQHDAVELLLDVCRCALAREEGAPFDPLRTMRDVDDTELSKSAVAGEYRRFQKLVYDDDFLILLRICSDATNFDTGAHVLGVHNLALHFGRLLALAGVATDLPLLSAGRSATMWESSAAAAMSCLSPRICTTTTRTSGWSTAAWSASRTSPQITALGILSSRI